MTSFRLGAQPRPSLSTLLSRFSTSTLLILSIKPLLFPCLPLLPPRLLSSPALSPKTSASLLLLLNQWECASLSHFKGWSWSLLSSAREEWNEVWEGKPWEGEEEMRWEWKKMKGEKRLKRWLWRGTKGKEKREGGQKEKKKPAWHNNTLLLICPSLCDWETEYLFTKGCGCVCVCVCSWSHA